MGNILAFKRIAFLTVLGSIDVWKIVLILRNIANVYNSRYPPFDSYFDKRHATTGDFRRMRMQMAYGDTVVMISTFCTATFRIVRVVFPYCSTLWLMTEKYSDVPLTRVYLYCACEMVFLRFLFIPINTMILLKGRGDRSTEKLLWSAFEGTAIDLMCLGMISATEGSDFDRRLLMIPPLLTFAADGLFKWFAKLHVETKANREVPIPSYLKDVLQNIGFPEEKVRIVPMYVTRPEINLSRFGVASELLVIHEFTMRIMSEDLVIGIVTQELGHWSYQHRFSRYMIKTVKTAVLSWLCVSSFNNEQINGIFGFIAQDAPHPYVPMSIALTVIWPHVSDLFNWTESLFHRRHVLETDIFAVKRSEGASLNKALVFLAGTSEKYTIFDEWYAAFLLGHPTVQERVARIDAHMKKIQ